jgi:hypothetical protein
LLLLGLTGVAMAGPVLTFGGLNLYGPLEFLSNLEVVAYFTSVASGAYWLVSFSSYLASETLYVTPNLMSGTIPLLNDSISALLSHNIVAVVLLPPSDPIFANIPEPLGLSLVVTGVAGLSFMRRRFRRGARG